MLSGMFLIYMNFINQRQKKPETCSGFFCYFSYLIKTILEYQIHINRLE